MPSPSPSTSHLHAPLPAPRSPSLQIHFIRHAEGEHNVETKRTGSNDCLLREGRPARDHPLWDARLTDVGINQARKLKTHLASRPSGGRSFTAFDLVVVSPLTRTCVCHRASLRLCMPPRCMRPRCMPPRCMHATALHATALHYCFSLLGPPKARLALHHRSLSRHVRPTPL